MYTLKTISDDQLLSDLETHFHNERRVSHIILLHLKEIEVRRLYADRGYADLFEMLIKYYHQSETSTYLRIKAVEFMIDMPQVDALLINGAVNLSTLALAGRQILREESFTKAKVSLEKKAEILKIIANKTQAQALIELMKLMPNSSKKPKTTKRRTSADATRLSMTFTDEVLEKMNRLKDLWAHVDPAMDPVEIINRAFEIALDKEDPTRKNVKQRKTAAVVQTGSRRPTYYSVETDKTLWDRAGARCEYVDEQTDRRCDCTFGLERDHILPLGLGGTSDLENLRLLCKTHNLLMARRHFGDEKIDEAIRVRRGRNGETERQRER